ncbi:MAG: FAD-dependent oxidoreductase [Desulfobacterales bacterium]|jgi:NADH dehydrogenase FAD-containing subunit
MGKHLVLVGGGHAHMTVMANLSDYIARGHRVTLIGPSAHHYYSGMGPGLLGGIYRPQDVRFNIKKMVEDRGAAFIQDTVVRIDADRKISYLNSGNEIPYDVVSCNTGSAVSADDARVVGEHIFPVKPIENLIKARQIVQAGLGTRTPKLVVVGGGAAALELTGNLWRLVQQTGTAAAITVCGGRNFLASMPLKAQRYARESLTARSIDIIEGAHVNRLKDGVAILEDQRKVNFDMALLAWGIEPSHLFRDSGLPTGSDGGLLVNSFLQSVAYPNIFGGGDCISFEPQPLDKVGVYAVRQNPVLYANLLAELEGRDLEAFEPQDTYLLIYNLGNGTGIFYRGNWVWKGRLIFFLKDYIDRKFMRKFQVSGETSEKDV